jgi:hypothetical protein
VKLYRVPMPLQEANAFVSAHPTGTKSLWERDAVE